MYAGYMVTIHVIIHNRIMKKKKFTDLYMLYDTHHLAWSG